VAGPVTMTLPGATPAAFAYTRSTLDVDTDGNGAADLLGATVDSLALDVTDATVAVADVVSLNVSGELALARVTPAGGAVARYTALKMGSVTVSLDGSPTEDFGFEVGFTLTVDGLDYNATQDGFDRLDWTKAFDLDGDGEADVLEPGLGLAIDLPSSLEFRLTGTLAGQLVAGPVTLTLPSATPAQFASGRGHRRQWCAGPAGGDGGLAGAGCDGCHGSRGGRRDP